MKVIASIPELIVRFSFQREEGDPEYNACKWADFYFDLNHWTLNINSNCGCYGILFGSGSLPPGKEIKNYEVPAHNVLSVPVDGFLPLVSMWGGEYLLTEMARSRNGTVDEYNTAVAEIFDACIKPAIQKWIHEHNDDGTGAV